MIRRASVASLLFLLLLLLLLLPIAASAQQQPAIDQALLQQLTQLAPAIQDPSSVSYKLQQLMQALPAASSFLQQAGFTIDYGDAVGRLEAALKNPEAAGTNQALIETLLAQVAALQAQIQAIAASGTATTTSAGVPPPILSVACPAISRALALGSRGDDVRSLQSFLIAQGLLAGDSATGYFGALTEAAVQAWQRAQGIVAEGTPATTGFGSVGPRTRVALENCTA